MDFTIDALKELKRAEYLAFSGQDCYAINDFRQKNNIDDITYHRMHNFNKARDCRTYRVKKRIQNYVLTGKAIFLTLTFTDDTLNKTNQKTRCRYVKKFLSEECKAYVANIDFGSKNGREHYHAVILPESDMIDYSKWSYGAINGKRIHNTEKDLKKVAKYITKLTSHAVKETTGYGQRIIYSR